MHGHPVVGQVAHNLEHKIGFILVSGAALILRNLKISPNHLVVAVTALSPNWLISLSKPQCRLLLKVEILTS